MNTDALETKLNALADQIDIKIQRNDDRCDFEGGTWSDADLEAVRRLDAEYSEIEKTLEAARRNRNRYGTRRTTPDSPVNPTCFEDLTTEKTTMNTQPRNRLSMRDEYGRQRYSVAQGESFP